MRWLKRLVASVSVLACCLSAGRLANASLGGYTITDYNIQVEVRENNTYYFTETLTVNFDEPRHGIYRTLPLRETVYRVDPSTGENQVTSSENRVQISDITANTAFKVNREDGKMKIRLGDADTTVTGEQTYVITYLYNPGPDRLKDADEFYYNLIGLEWDVPIEHASFDVELPKDFDAEQVGLSTGSYGYRGTDDVNYEVDGLHIRGTVLRTLEPGEGLNIRVTLPDDYFINAGFAINYVLIFLALVCVGIFIVAFFWWSTYGRDEPVVETVEFYPPEGLNSAEVGLVYSEVVTNDAVISLLIYLADKGYLRIVDTGDKNKKKSYRLEKVKDYDGSDEAARRFFAGLFSRKDRVTSADLTNKFYLTVNEVTELLKNGKIHKTTWDSQAREKQNWTAFLAAASLSTCILMPMWFYQPDLVESLWFFIVAGALGLAFVMIYMSKGVGLLLAITGVGMAFLTWFGTSGADMMGDSVAIIFSLLGLAASSGTLVLALYMDKLTDQGREWKGKILGLRRFLITAEKNRLEALVSENPQYFYNILPYTYALGVSEVWVKQFRDLLSEPPDWYSSSGPFNPYAFNSFMNDTMRTAKAAMVSQPSSSGSGYSSGGHGGGGGFSGGGHGGGGGGSW